MSERRETKKEPPFELVYKDWKPHYLVSMGELSPFFREIMNNKRILASKCPKCGKVWMPPRGYCPDCYEENIWVPLTGEGTIISCTYVYFVGHAIDLVGFIDLPYVYALVHMDGTDTYISHGVKPKSQKMGEIKPGTRVKAVFREERRGTLGDFYFVAIE